MQINTAQSATATAGFRSDAGFSAIMDGSAFQVLISNLYKDKERAVVRETIANCRDANNMRDILYGTITADKIQSGDLSDSELELYEQLKAQGYADPQTPYRIHIPTDLEPWLEFEDFGIGLTVDEAIGEVDKVKSKAAGRKIRGGGLLNTLFNSSKRGENDSIGGFGLGCKCPLSIVDSFSYRIIKNGEEHQFIVFLSDSGVPDVNWLTSTEEGEPAPIPTDRENGVIVRLDTVAPDLFGYLKTCISDVLQTFPESEQPIINGGMFEFTPMEKIQLVDEAYIVERFKYGTMFNNKFLVECGGVVYPIDYTRIKDEELFDQEAVGLIESYASNRAVVFQMPLGSIKMPPSREEISYDDTTCENIARVIKDASDRISIDIAEKVAAIDFTSRKSIVDTVNELRLKYFSFKTSKALELVQNRWHLDRNKPQYADYNVVIKETSSSSEWKLELLKRSPLLLSEIKEFGLLNRRHPDPHKASGSTFHFQLFRSPYYITENAKVGDNTYRDLNDWRDSKLRNYIIEVDDPSLGANINSILQKLLKSWREACRVPLVSAKDRFVHFANLMESLRYDDKDVNLFTMNTFNGYERFELVKNTKETFKVDLATDEANSLLLYGYSPDLIGPPNRTDKRIAKYLTESTRSSIERRREMMSVMSEELETVAFKLSELEALNSSMREFIRKNKPKAPKASEIMRNVRTLYLSPNKDHNIAKSIGLEELYYTDAGERVSERLEGDGDPLFWVTEQDVKDLETSGKLFYAEYDCLSYFKRSIETKEIYVVKGIRAASRKAFETSDNAIQLKPEHILEDCCRIYEERVLDGTHDIHTKIPLSLTYRYGYKDVLGALHLAKVISEDKLPSCHEISYSLNQVLRNAKSNHNFAKLLELEGIDIENAVEFIRHYCVINRDFSRLVANDDPLVGATDCYTYRNATNKMAQTCLPRHQQKRLRSRLRKGFLDLHCISNDTFDAYTRIAKNVVGVDTLWESDVKAIKDIVRIMRDSDRPRGKMQRAYSCSSEDISNYDMSDRVLNDFTLDVNRITKKLVSDVEIGVGYVDELRSDLRNQLSFLRLDLVRKLKGGKYKFSIFSKDDCVFDYLSERVTYKVSKSPYWRLFGDEE